MDRTPSPRVPCQVTRWRFVRSRRPLRAPPGHSWAQVPCRRDSATTVHPKLQKHVLAMCLLPPTAGPTQVPYASESAQALCLQLQRCCRVHGQQRGRHHRQFSCGLVAHCWVTQQRHRMPGLRAATTFACHDVQQALYRGISSPQLVLSQHSILGVTPQPLNDIAPSETALSGTAFSGTAFSGIALSSGGLLPRGRRLNARLSEKSRQVVERQRELVIRRRGA